MLHDVVDTSDLSLLTLQNVPQSARLLLINFASAMMYFGPREHCLTWQIVVSIKTDVQEWPAVYCHVSDNYY